MNDRSDKKTYTFEELLQKQGFIVYTNVGSSMLPFLREKKDIIEIKPKQRKFKKYDVILYKKDGQYILHRILKITTTGYSIAGDHNVFLETDIKDENILGVMTRVIRNGKTITPDNILYKAYVHLWCDFYPVRMWIIRMKQRIWNIMNKRKHKLKT